MNFENFCWNNEDVSVLLQNKLTKLKKKMFWKFAKRVEKLSGIINESVVLFVKMSNEKINKLECPGISVRLF